MEAGSLRMYPIFQTPNFKIISDTTTGGPALPTIAELSPAATSKAQWIFRGRRSALFLPNGEFVSQVKLHHHLQPRLADSASSASDVYLVTRPEPFVVNPVGSLQHWSFYTQGIFYHLSAPELPRDTIRKSRNAAKSRDAGCRLKYEDLSDIDTGDYIRARNSTTRKVLLAYKVGQTDYRSDQIMLLANWTVQQLSVYGLFTANCQHFATTMVRRTVMRVGDRSAFAGTLSQLVDWDFERGSQPHINSIERGFVVAPRLPVRGYIQPKRIRVLYEKGPDAIEAWHPPGYWAKRFNFIGIELCGACREFKDDLKHKRWKDAFYGRYIELPDGTRKRPLQRSSKSHNVQLDSLNVPS